MPDRRHTVYGTCPVCQQHVPIIRRDVLAVHGPVDARCSGSRQDPEEYRADAKPDDPADVARIWVCPVCQVHRRADLPREHGPRGGRPCVGGRRAGSFAGEESTDG